MGSCMEVETSYDTSHSYDVYFVPKYRTFFVRDKKLKNFKSRSDAETFVREFDSVKHNYTITDRYGRYESLQKVDGTLTIIDSSI